MNSIWDSQIDASFSKFKGTEADIIRAFQKLENDYSNASQYFTVGNRLVDLMNKKEDVGGLNYANNIPLITKAQSGNKAAMEELEFTFLYYLLCNKATLMWAAFGRKGLSKVDAIAQVTGAIIELKQPITYATILSTLGRFGVAQTMNSLYSPLPNLYGEEDNDNDVTVEQIEAEFSKGVEAITSGDNAGAAKFFKKALDLGQASGLANDDWESCCCFNLGEALKMLEQYDNAIPYYQKAIEKKIHNEDAYTCLAECYFGLETVEGLQNVVKTLNRCTSLFPNNETAHYNTGIAHFKIGDMDKALQSFKKSLELGNEDAEMYVNVLQKYA